MQNKPFVTYLKNQSPTPQLNAHGHGWIELPNGQLWNPATRFNFSVPKCRRPGLIALLKRIGGRDRG
jgi:hypothetical protein